jgi:Methylase involved in ubiquinone/menaquinone biosynthesis
MNAHGESRDVQRAQTEYRLRLADFWEIHAGASVLEIGCGQGDMTAVLACRAGADGFVHGTDIASGSYGTPVTLEHARENLLSSPLVARLRIDFDTDILSPDFKPFITYDYAVLAHSAWYFSSREELRRVLEKARSCARKLCVAEWDARVQNSKQLPHWNAAMIQAVCACFDCANFSNIRTLLTRADIASIAQSAGWSCKAEQSIDTAVLQDGKWEIEMVAREFPELLQNAQGMPQKLKDMLLSQIKELANADLRAVLPLNGFALLAE